MGRQRRAVEWIVSIPSCRILRRRPVVQQKKRRVAAHTQHVPRMATDYELHRPPSVLCSRDAGRASSGGRGSLSA
jgi:hypothetical protein